MSALRYPDRLTLREMAPMMRAANTRLSAKIAESASGCWEWTAARDACGYGRFGMRGENALAHRCVYELLVGSIPDGLTLDHLCRNRGCVNPAHLEVVSLRENILRGTGVGARNAAKTHCPQGHEYSPENTYVDPQGKRSCRICGRARERRRRA